MAIGDGDGRVQVGSRRSDLIGQRLRIETDAHAAIGKRNLMVVHSNRHHTPIWSPTESAILQSDNCWIRRGLTYKRLVEGTRGRLYS